MLEPVFPLGSYDATFGDLRLWERTELALVSLAIPLGGAQEAEKALKSAYGLDLPKVGMSASTAQMRVLRMSTDQAMLVFASDAPLVEPDISAALNGACYTTNQTDAWVGLSMEGTQVRAVLARLCPLDLHPAAFPIDMAVRTVMEHMGVVILREDTDRFTLLSASSSAGSFLHALTTSVAYTQ